MYVTRRDSRVDDASERGFLAEHDALHAAMLSATGFRWAMLLRSTEEPARLASVEMWQTGDEAEAFRQSSVPASLLVPPLGYDVVTARGSMTPATFAAFVDWEVDGASSASFVNRWNAAFHGVEDKLSSRLLQQPGQPARLAGMHVVTEEAQLKPAVLTAEIKLVDGTGIRPLGIERFEVVLLTEP